MKVWAGRTGTLAAGLTSVLPFRFARGRLRRLAVTATDGTTTPTPPELYGFAVIAGNQRWPSDADTYMTARDIGDGPLRPTLGMEWGELDVQSSEGIQVVVINWSTATAMTVNVTVVTD